MELTEIDNNSIVQYAPFNNSPINLETNDIISSKRLESDNNLSEIEKSLKTLKIDIHNFVNTDWDDINKDIKKFGNNRIEEGKDENLIFDNTDIINSIESMKIKIKNTHSKYLESERKLIEVFNKNTYFLKKVDDFNNFIDNYSSNKNINIEQLKIHLLDLINKNNDDNNLRILISDFVERREEITQLLKAVRIVQHFQAIPCCPLCMSAPLDSFMNPCGHTGCKECLIKSLHNNQTMNNEINFNCPICRKNISSINPLYIL